MGKNKIKVLRYPAKHNADLVSYVAIREYEYKNQNFYIFV
jgi:hypothetical protein